MNTRQGLARAGVRKQCGTRQVTVTKYDRPIASFDRHVVRIAGLVRFRVFGVGAEFVEDRLPSGETVVDMVPVVDPGFS